MKKFLRKIVLISALIIMLAAIVVGVGVIFAVRNVNVNLLSYSYGSLIRNGCSQDDAAYTENGKAAEQKRILLDEFRGTVIGFVSEEKIEAVIKDSGYTLESMEIVYPCTLNVTLKERMETFAVANGDKYDIYDENGVLIRTGENVNSLDGAPNITVIGTSGAVGATIESVAEISAVFGRYFNGLRSTVGSVEIVYEGVGEAAISHLIFRMLSGIDIRIINFAENSGEKIEKAYERYSKLDGAQKLGGEVYAMTGFDGEILADYQRSKY